METDTKITRFDQWNDCRQKTVQKSGWQDPVNRGMGVMGDRLRTADSDRAPPLAVPHANRAVETASEVDNSIESVDCRGDVLTAVP